MRQPTSALGGAHVQHSLNAFKTPVTRWRQSIKSNHNFTQPISAIVLAPPVPSESQAPQASHSPLDSQPPRPLAKWSPGPWTLPSHTKTQLFSGTQFFFRDTPLKRNMHGLVTATVQQDHGRRVEGWTARLGFSQQLKTKTTPPRVVFQHHAIWKPHTTRTRTGLSL